MTRGNKRWGILAGVCLLTAWNSPSAWSADAKAGKATYDKLCASCHGADGKGNPAMTKALGEKGLNIVGKETKAKKDDELLKIIAEGAGKMPASGKGLSEQERKDVLAHTRSLAK
jgi:mono/diheme cytochrome c family protein